MPVRFRCAYCNQLLGIARRKAGQVVRCPTCAGQVVVPQPEGEEDSPPEPRPQPPPLAPDAGPAQPLFERSDFDELFNEPVVQQPIPGHPLEPASAPAVPPAGSPKKGPPPPPMDGAFDVEPVNPAPARPTVGIVLSPIVATILTVVWIATVAMAFATGWLIRHFLS